MAKLPTYCTSHQCPTYTDMGPGIARCEKGGELFYLVDGQLSDKPYEAPRPRDPPPNRKKEQQGLARALREDRLPRFTGQGMPRPVQDSGHTFILPNSSHDIPKLDTSEAELERQWKEEHEPRRHFIPKTIWKLGCAECHKSWHSKPDPAECHNPEHTERYQAHLKKNREA